MTYPDSHEVFTRAFRRHFGVTPMAYRASALRDASPAITVAVHAGAYEQLGDTYAAMERWMEANRYRSGDAPWESYVTDPGELPDVKDWRTEIYWPLKK